MAHMSHRQPSRLGLCIGAAVILICIYLLSATCNKMYECLTPASFYASFPYLSSSLDGGLIDPQFYGHAYLLRTAHGPHNVSTTTVAISKLPMDSHNVSTPTAAISRLPSDSHNVSTTSAAVSTLPSVQPHHKQTMLPTTTLPSIAERIWCQDSLCYEFLTQTTERETFSACLQKTKVHAGAHMVNGSCHFMNGTGRPAVALASFPGSGNTWVRGLLEKATGVCTGEFVQHRV